MPTKNKGQQTSTNGNGQKTSAVSSESVALVSGERILDEDLLIKSDSPRPYRLNPESSEEMEKRLAKRKALTLKAFGIAYNNHHIRKVS